MRSGSVTRLLNTAGLNVQVIKGGYKSYRNFVLEQFSKSFKLVICGGPTGSKKTDVLHYLKQAGEHSIDISEPVFGLSVTGLIHPSQIKTNSSANTNDLLYLTKPLVSGIFSSALKRNILKTEDYQSLVLTLTELNNIGEKLGSKKFVNAMTDVTGFGLIGHLNEMCEASSVSAQISYSKIPFLEGLEFYINQFCYTDNTTRNLNMYKDKVESMDGLKFISLCNPQTNGGLLFSVNSDYKTDLETLFAENGLILWHIGKIIPK